MKRLIYLSGCSLFLLIFTSCLTQQPYHISNEPVSSIAPDSQLRYSFFLIGETYRSTSNQSPELRLLQNQLLEAGEKGVALWMGNNGTKHGLPEGKFETRRAKAESAITERLKILDGFDGQVIMMPGYNDWDAGGPHGYANVLNQEEFIEEELMDEKNVFFPDDACPGPVEIDIADDLLLLVINTQWVLHEWEKPLEESLCDVITEADLLVKIEDVLRRNAHRKVILAGHHPMFSNGLHGGYFPAAMHLLPPVLGALYVEYRQSAGNRKDLSNRRYTALRKSLVRVLDEFPNLIYVSGLENSLQYHKVKDQHYIIAGSLDKATGVAAGNNAQFAHGETGFGKINVYENGDIWLEFWTAENGGSLVYRHKLLNHQYQVPDPEQYGDLDFSGQTASSVGNLTLGRDKSNPGWRGNNYRDEWTTTISNVPVFDIGKEKGGLTPIKRGGGLQTMSLRMEAEDGKQYVLRSIEKFPEKAVPKMLRGTVATDVVSDQISASHPYAALAIPTMASAVGVYHTNPRLVYVPDDPRFGVYQEDLADGLFLFEERPNDNWEDQASFGNSKDIISTFDVIDNLKSKKRHFVDQEHVVLSRLFDIVIGDWDRHDDQWRWASFKEDDFTTYRPIPRDRDQAFFWGDGALLQLASHKWGNPKYQGFHHEIRDVEGLEFNARWFDRSFLTGLSWESWQQAVERIQKGLTDEVIEQGLSQLPPEIYALNGEVIISKLKKRRDDLTIYARTYYEFLAKDVDVVGTKHEELFEIKRLANGETEIVVTSLNKDGERQFQRYQRVFSDEETQEIRLYGRGGEDKFVISGSESATILVRVVGGKGDDIVQNTAQGAAASKVLFYDNNKKDNEVTGKVGNRTRPNNGPNKYNRAAFKYNTLLPLILLSFNPDDGIYFGGGFIYTKHGFRKEPFSSRHSLTGLYAIRSGSFDLNYRAEFTDVIRKWDFLFDAAINRPNFAQFFYGFGNKTRSNEDLRDEDRQFYRARYAQLRFTPSLRGNFGKHEIRLGGYWRSVEIKTENNDDEALRFIFAFADSVGRGSDSESPLLDVPRSYLGGFLSYTYDSRDNANLPKRGFYFNAEGTVASQISDEENNYQRLTSEAAFYISTGGTLNTTLAVRVGGSTLSGDVEFYQANYLGGGNGLRGYRIYRFTGDQTFYQNTELRIKLADFRTRVLPGQLGINLFYDIGRVWSDDPTEQVIDNTLDSWHNGYGAGFWIAPLGRTVLSAEYSTSTDEGLNLFFFRFGFLF